MNLNDALTLLDETEDAILSRPYLLEERGTYITHEGPGVPMKLRWLKHSLLATDWAPSPTELRADDWKVLTLYGVRPCSK